MLGTTSLEPACWLLAALADLWRNQRAAGEPQREHAVPLPALLARADGGGSSGKGTAHRCMHLHPLQADTAAAAAGAGPAAKCLPQWRPGSDGGGSSGGCRPQHPLAEQQHGPSRLAGGAAGYGGFGPSSVSAELPLGHNHQPDQCNTGCGHAFTAPRV